MNRVVSLSTYLESYNITKDVFMSSIENEREFFDKYIEWGKTDADTILSPKAIERLGEIFNEPTDNDERVDMSGFMNSPELNKNEGTEEPKKVTKRTRRKKPKYSINKQFLQEHGRADVGDSSALKQLRTFLMGDGVHKVEDVALMTDEEVQETFSKSFYVIRAEEGCYIIKRSALSQIIGDISFVGNF